MSAITGQLRETEREKERARAREEKKRSHHTSKCHKGANEIINKTQLETNDELIGTKREQEQENKNKHMEGENGSRNTWHKDKHKIDHYSVTLNGY